ncbi:MAG: ankyrin repeat domain-containing protein [Betaproteobacteria bacterium]|nr:ankyrin repeat domain-containing protein [Betaproteobacteria bacterium]
MVELKWNIRRALDGALCVMAMMLAGVVAAQQEKRPDLDRKFVDFYNKAEFVEAWKIWKQGADPDATLMPGGLTPLEHAGIHGMTKHIAFLSSVDAKSVDSALILAISRHAGNAASRRDTADQLVKIGANPQAVDKYGRSVMYWTAKVRDDVIMQRLVTRGGVPDIYSKLMLCPAAELPAAVKQFLGDMDELCQCAPGTRPRMSSQAGRYSRWCEGADGRRLGLEVEGRLDPTPAPGHWGDWHPREIIAARIHESTTPTTTTTSELYRCQNMSCMRSGN